MTTPQAEAILRQVEGLLLQAQGLLAGLRALPMATPQVTPPTPALPQPLTIHDEPELQREAGLRGSILDLLSTCDRPMKGCLIARRLHREDDSHLRTILAQLRKEGKLDHYHGKGYWPTTRPTPADIDRGQTRKGA